MTGSSQATGGQTYNFSYAYNLTEALKSETYPSGRVVATSYDGANRAANVSGTYMGNVTKYVQNVSYWPAGDPYYFTHGNNVVPVWTYNSRLQLSLLYATVGNSGNNYLAYFRYGWGTTNNNGTLQSVSEGYGNSIPYGSLGWLSQSYSYDQVNRLTKVSDSGYTRAFSYDAYGNMWVTNSSGAPLAGNTPTSDIYSLANQMNGQTYDGAGNLTSLNGNTASHDAENRLITVTEVPALGGGAETLAYDGLGERVEKTVVSSATAYVYDAFGQLAADYSNTANSAPACRTCYLTSDHLGSVRMVTDQNANVIARHDYLPFGEEIPAGYAGRAAPFGNSDYLNPRFTGQIRDQETGEDFFNLRSFTAALGRFNSPDPGNLGADMTYPQSWNGYSYVRNNPLNSVDPSGACDVVIGGITQTPNTPDTVAQQAFAQSIGAISVFPYANGSVPQGVAAVAQQSTNNVTPETQVVMNALSAAAAEGEPVNVYAFSGGAQALTTALNNLPSSVTSQINNISYVSPGALQDLASSPTGGDTALVRSTGLLDLGIIGSVSPLLNPSKILTTSCGFFGHSANCEFQNAAAFLRQFRGTPCTGLSGMFVNSQSKPPASAKGGGGGGRGSATSTITYGPPYNEFDWWGLWVNAPLLIPRVPIM